MTDIERQVIEALIKAATPFLDGAIVDETDGTIPLMNVLEKAIEAARNLLS